MDELDNLEDLQQQAAALDRSLGGAAEVAAQFDGELRRMRAAMAETGKDISTLERGLSGGLRRALDGVLFDGMKASDALRVVGRSISNTAYSAAARPVTDHFGGMIAKGVGAVMEGVLPFAQGASFSQGR